MIVQVRAALAVLAGTIGLGFSEANAACQLQQVSEFHVVVDHGEPLVDATINGKPVRFVVDTGSSWTMLSPAGANRLGLRFHRLYNVTFSGVNGGEEPNETTIDELRIGNMVAKGVQVAVAGRNRTSDRYVGLLGQDLLSQADIELDLANQAIRIFRPKGCEGDQVVYWNKPYSLANLVPSNDRNEIKVAVTLNGKPEVADLDTGAGITVITKALAERVGVTPAISPVRPAESIVGVSGPPLRTMQAVFPALSIGDETIKNARLRMAEMYAADGVTEIGTMLPVSINYDNMLIGLDFVAAHRIYIARSQGKMYFSYNGGPIFRGLDEAPATAPAAPTPSKK